MKYENLPIFKAAIELCAYIKTIKYHKYTIGSDLRSESRATLCSYYMNYKKLYRDMKGKDMKKQICALLCLAGVLNATDPLEAQCSRDDSKDIVVCQDAVHGTLIWQDGNEDIKKEWKEAKEYCKNLNYAGYTDWRLPTKTELLSIVDYARYDPAINKAFKNGKSDWCWSSTLDAKRSSDAWLVYFSGGGADGDDLSYSDCVLCVRQ